jgi:hypothetical protein
VPRLTPEAQHSAIEGAFRKLPIARPDDPERLSYESLIPAIPRQLLVERGNVWPVRPENEKARKLQKAIETFQRRNELTSTATAKKELAAVRRYAEKLLQALNALHKPTIDALNFRREALFGAGGLSTTLRILIATASSADIPELPATAGRGRRVNTQARRIALEVATHFYGLTGKMPTIRTRADTGVAYGPFLQLLKEIFAALEMRAGAENHARWAVKAMEEYRPKLAN